MAERQLAGHRLILTMRPEAMLPREASEFANRHRPQGIHLDGLSEAVAALVAVRLGAHEVAPKVGRFIHERSAGNPFFAEELALALRERGQVAAEGVLRDGRRSRKTFSARPARYGARSRSRTYRSAERPAAALLKVAAVIGTVAPMKAVKEIFSAVGDSDDLADEFAVFQGRLLAEVEDRDGEALLAFRHGITRSQPTACSRRRSGVCCIGPWGSGTKRNMPIKQSPGSRCWPIISVRRTRAARL